MESCEYANASCPSPYSQVPANMPDSEASWLWPAYSQNQAGLYMPDPTSCIQFSKEGPDHTVQNWPRSSLGGLVRFGPNASGLKASQCAGIIRPGFWQNTTGPLPVSHVQIQLHSSTDGPDHMLQNYPRSDLVLADCVVFGPNRSGPEANQCARIVQPTSGQFFRADPDQMQIGSGMFTGVLLWMQKLRSPVLRSQS